MPYPSDGDVMSAMEEVRDQDMWLEELLTPICLLDQGKVDVFPFAIRENRYQPIHWESALYEDLMPQPPGSPRWYDTSKGKARISEELAAFDNVQVKVDVRKGSDGSYRFHVPLGKESPLRLVMLCPDDYPVNGPEVALYDESSQKYEPVDSRILDEWSFYTYLADLLTEYQKASRGDGNSA
jgi:hypothetical protein